MDDSAAVDDYHLLEELGSGSFGVVYKAIETATGDIVAIKHIDLESSEEDIQEIQGEINVLSTCASPFVTQYKTSFLRGSKLWIVMEYLGGGSCQDLLKPGPFNEGHVAIVCRELLLGLDYLHREGKIHRDIKAANVLLANSGTVKLADFGVAAQLTDIKSIRHTFVGTPFWMAPEVIQESGYDFRADIWSLGITAMEMINGEPPNASIHPMKVLFLIPKEPAPRLQGNPYSKELKDFVAACLVKDPTRRPSARELLQHRFIRGAGKVEALQELIQRRQMWDASKGRHAHPKFYEETLRTMPPTNQEEDWVFDTVKAPAMIVPKQTAKLRRPSIPSSPKPVEQTPENMMANLSLNEMQVDGEQRPAPSTMRRVSTKRRASGTQTHSTAKRKTSVQRQPLAPDTSFGNSASTARQFRRISDSSPAISLSGSLGTGDENTPPAADASTKEALIGRRAYAKAIDPAFQEIHAQTSSQHKREAISRVAQAFNTLDLEDPEGQYHLIKLIIEKVQKDPKLSALLPASSQPAGPHKPPKLVLADGNFHLKGHKRGQSSSTPRRDSFPDKQLNLPGQSMPGMEHTKQLADVLYAEWIEGLRNRWPVVP